MTPWWWSLIMLWLVYLFLLQLVIWNYHPIDSILLLWITIHSKLNKPTLNKLSMVFFVKCFPKSFFVVQKLFSLQNWNEIIKEFCKVFSKKDYFALLSCAKSEIQMKLGQDLWNASKDTLCGAKSLQFTQLKQRNTCILDMLKNSCVFLSTTNKHHITWMLTMVVGWSIWL
jgi:hypothetical protein